MNLLEKAAACPTMLPVNDLEPFIDTLDGMVLAALESSLGEGKKCFLD